MRIFLTNISSPDIVVVTLQCKLYITDHVTLTAQSNSSILEISCSWQIFLCGALRGGRQWNFLITFSLATKKGVLCPHELLRQIS